MSGQMEYVRVRMLISSFVWRLLIGGFITVHGMIHWLDFSWLLKVLGIKDTGLRSLGTLLCMLATMGFVATGLGIFGVPILLWRWIAVASAAASLMLLVLAWHPWLMAGVLIDIGILSALLRHVL